jgi:hypothetical protein
MPAWCAKASMFDGKTADIRGSSEDDAVGGVII